MHNPIGSDICICGDYRSQHGWGADSKCKVCFGSKAPYDQCAAFRFSRMATESEIKHWWENCAPKRIQRKRSRGWKMPENTVYVGCPTIWGNPFDMSRGETRMSVVTWYRMWFTGKKNKLGSNKLREQVWDRIAELRGKDLACWCPLDQPCHADILLEVANS